MENLKGRTLRGGLAKICGQGANFVLRFAYIMILARLLTPEDFGLVAMVTVVTGIFELFTSAGLSSAMIQQATITNAQISKLFWVNLLVGALLALLCVAAAPVLVWFFHEPRLLWVTIAMAPAFLFGAAGVQHMAILQRQLRYVTITVIEIVALLSSLAVGLPDDDLGQVPHAIVQSAPDSAADMDEAGVIAFLAERIAGYKVPRTVEFTDRPLRDDAGKARRSAVRDEIISRRQVRSHR